MRTAVRAAILAPALLLLLQLSGSIYLPWLAVLEHAVLERVMVAGWTIDEARTALPAWAQAAALLVTCCLLALGLGAAGPGSPAARAEAGAVVELARAPLGLLLAVPLAAFVLLGAATAPSTFWAVAATAGTEVPVPEPARRRQRLALAGVLACSLAALAFSASMLATSRQGTFYDQLSDLLGSSRVARAAILAAAALLAGLALRCGSHRRKRVAAILAAGSIAGLASGPAVGVIAGGAAALSLLAGRAGLPSLPDLLRAPGRWPWELGRAGIAAAAALLGSLAFDVTACPEPGTPGVSLVAGVRAAFDLDVDDDGHLAVVQREEGVLRVFELREGSTAALLHEIPARRGDLEEVLAIPGGRGFLVTEILDEEPKTLLLVVDPVTGAVREEQFAGMCWVSSVAWDPAREAVLLGCETAPDLFAFRTDTMNVVHVGQLDSWDDSEDVALRTDRREMFAVSLAEGDRLRAVDPDTGAVLRQARIGGLNYQVVHDPPTHRVLVSRFCDGQVVAFDDETLDVEGRVRLGFSVRPLVAVPSRRLLLAGSMFRGQVDLIDADRLERTGRVRTGGRTKSIAVSGDSAWVGTACGVYELDLRKLAPEAMER